VKLYLPKSSDRPVVPEIGAETASLRPASGHETILAVEDDADVLVVASESLRELGYQVVTAGNAAQALEILKGDQPVDLSLSDVIMPGGMNGVQLTVEARRIWPELKVLLTSGYTAAALTLEHGLPDNSNVVEKPYRREETGQETQAGDRRIDLLPRARGHTGDWARRVEGLRVFSPRPGWKAVRRA
jgi:CheY-like chemotaxis protein